MWFERHWLGKIVEFENHGSSWKIIARLSEDEMQYTDDEFEVCKLYSQACSVFICEETKDSTQAIMKI